MIGKVVALSFSFLLIVLAVFAVLVFIQVLQLSGGLRNLMLGLLIGFIFVTVGAFNSLMKTQGGWRRALETLSLLEGLQFLTAAVFMYLLSLFGFLMVQLFMMSCFK